MKKPTQTEVNELVNKIMLPFYRVKRDMTVKDLGGKYRDENDAEHSWSLALLACTLAPHIDPLLDIGMVAQFATVHDLVEVYAGDVSVWAGQQALDSKQQNEANALQKITSQFKHFPWLVDNLVAYEKQDSNEARYVRAVDKYIALCIRFAEGGRFFHEHKITHERFTEGLKLHRTKAHIHKGVAEYYELIRADFDNHPEHFFDGD